MMLWLLACNPPETATPGPAPRVGVLGEGSLNPFPSAELVVDGHLAIPEGALPQAEGGTAWDVARLNWREGFSVVQPSVVRLPVEIDAASLPGEGAIGTGGSVRIVDLDSGEEIPLFAELDAYPDIEERTLIVRPMKAMTVGHRVAVVLTDAVTSGGQPLALAEWADARAKDPHYAELADRLDALGIPGVALAWDFPIGDGTAPMRALAAAVGVPGAYTLDRALDVDTQPEGNLPPGVWKKAEGSFTTDNWLVDDTLFAVDAAGIPVAQGTTEAYLYVHIPESVRGAEPGSVPVFVFGHGILSNPGNYLDEDDDPSAVVALSNELGAIFVATVWRGLTTSDQPEAVGVARDFGSFPALSDKLAQGVANNLALIRLVREGALLDDALFEGLADPSRVYWYGISLGSIEGAVTLANQTAIEHAVLHVGGSDWSTMLERSSNWPPFEFLVGQTIEDAGDRQLLYATSQLLWDAVDPADYADDLRGRSILWQEAMGDNQVPNLSTELLMRSIGVPLGAPSVSAPMGVEQIALPTQAPVFTQFDPEVGYPPEENRPATNTDAHGIPRLFPGCIRQTTAFFNPGALGLVQHFCGSAPCSASSPGE